MVSYPIVIEQRSKPTVPNLQYIPPRLIYQGRNARVESMSDKGIALLVIGALLVGAVGFYYLYVSPGGEAPPTTTAPPTTQAPTTQAPSTTAPPTKKPRPPRSPKPTPPPTTSGPGTSPPPAGPGQVDYASLWSSLPAGTWARYEMKTPQGVTMYMTVTVHGRESRKGVECIKVTYEFEVPAGQQAVATSATAWISVETGETVEVQVCLPGIGCQTATPQQSQQYEYVPPEGSPVVGVETITVPAGTFTCYKISYKGATVWWSADAPPLGIVKAIYSSGAEMTLVELGS